jgi:hypothetical protein
VYCAINEWNFLSCFTFYVFANTAPLISQWKVEKTIERMLRVAPFLPVPSCRGAVCASIHLLWESTCLGLTYMSSKWTWSPLAVKMMSVARSGEWFTTLST